MDLGNGSPSQMVMPHSSDVCGKPQASPLFCLVRSRDKWQVLLPLGFILWRGGGGVRDDGLWAHLMRTFGGRCVF